MKSAEKRSSLESLIFRNLLLVVLGASLLRLVLWTGYEFFEWRRGAIVLHEEIDEFVLLVMIDLVLIPMLIWLIVRITQSVTRPLKEIAGASASISGGRLEERIPTGDLPGGELTEVAEALNAAFDRYAETHARMARFTGDASHQLRTPLSAIQTTAELALANQGIGDECHLAMESILHESQRLHRLCETLLRMSRLDRQQHAGPMAPVDLASLVHKISDTFGQLAEARDIELITSCPLPLRVEGDDNLLFELLANLLDNAIKVCGEGDRIRLSLQRESTDGILLVEDSGPGIARETEQQLFERFRRSPETSYEGSGLGLALCVEICRVHGGSIEPCQSTLGGAGFKVRLPALEEGPG